ncbi:MAG: ATP-dependent RecD-like DNA helicase [Nanoarchaeota archaeon]
MNDNIENQKITGIVEKIIFHNRDNGYHILSIELPNKKDNVVIHAYHPTIHEGLTYEFEGEWGVHPVHGKQMKAKSIFEVPPNTKEGLKAYLSSSFFPGIGPVIAGRIISYFKDDVIRIFNEDIDKLLLVPGISPRKLEAIKRSWEDNDEINNVMMFLQQYGISTVYAAKIYKHYGKGCVQKIKENPYTLARDIKGIGFKYADKIALEVGIAPDSEARIRACIMHILESGSMDGHCYLLEEQITTASTELLSVDIRDRVSFILKYMIQDHEIMLYTVDEGPNRYYSKKLYYNEIHCANTVGRLLLGDIDAVSGEEILKGYRGVELSQEQKDGVYGIINKGVSILTGGPGTGKSTMTKAVVAALLNLGKTIALAAPTGRASQRMTEVIGRQASTVHKLLGWDPENFGFMHNEKNPLWCNFLIIDESSMLDINLASSILKAVPDDCQVLFIGDVDQLPPVGPGNFFKDLIESGVVPTFKLTQIFRQGKESEIISYAHKINSGEHPNINSPLTDPGIWKDGTDCMFIDSGLGDSQKPKSEYPQWSSLRYGMDVVDMVKNLYIDTIKKYHNSSDIQILIPMKISEIGTVKINELIQQSVNPPHRDKNQISLKDRVFREGDKVIHTINNYDIEVFNGDIGWIESIDVISGTAQIKFGDDRVVNYKKVDMLELELAYAITIHKSQGSEFDCVILPIMTQYSRMLYRNLLYTGLTRAKKLAVFVGQRKAFSKAIDNIDPRVRQTSLKELLIKTDIINSFIAP